METRNNTLFKPMAAALFATAALLLTGCATVTSVQSDVQSFSAAPAPVQAGTFTFERLPSQEQDAGQAVLLEGMAQAALQKVGFTRNDTNARYSVQVGAWTTDAVVTYPDPFFGRPLWSPFGRPRLWHGRLMYYSSPWPDREIYVTRVRLEIRDRSSGKIVYESTATNEQTWFTAERVLPAMFEAVLADFPSPPKGARKVTIKLPPKA
ncbi:MAG: DUF4136 domain-containing protein [Pseudomonadota bacterium]